MQLLRHLILGMVLGFALPVGAQNLVPNWDFSTLDTTCVENIVGNETDLLHQWFGEANFNKNSFEGNFFSFIHNCRKNSSSPLWWRMISPGSTLQSKDIYDCDTFDFLTFPSPVKGQGYLRFLLADTIRLTGAIDSLRPDCSTKNSQISGTFITGEPKALMQVKIDKPLTSLRVYVLDYYLRPERWARTHLTGINHFGFNLSQDTFKIQKIYNNGFSPTGEHNKLIYKDKWHHLVQSFTAVGGEQFLTLGNFKTFDKTRFFNMGCDTPCTSSYLQGTFIPPQGYFYDAVRLYRPEDTVFNAFLPPSDRFCEGDEVTLTAQDTGFKLTEPIRSYQWSTGDTTQSITVDSAGTYTVTVWYDDRWWDTASFTYRLHPEYQSELPDSVRSCPDRQVTLRANPAAPNQELQWSDGTLSNSLTVQPPDTVVLTAVTPCDTVRDTVIVTGDACPPDFKAPEFAIPDAFTPNGDGLNDTWDIYNLPEDNEVWVMNRWGEVLFHTKNYRGEWDGTNQRGEQLPGGVYVYKIVYYWAEGSFRDVKQGHITLIRR